MAGQQPVFVVNQAPERQQGRKAQISNITAAKTVADVIRSCLGPKAMLKMLLDPMGGILLTNDGHAILREIEVAHPAAKSMIELSRTQDEEVGDGTTSVIILAGEILAQSLASLEAGIHPVVIIAAYKRALAEALSIIDRISVPVNVADDDEMLALIKTSINTKFVSRWSDLMCRLALKAVRTVAVMDASAPGNSGLIASASSASLNLSRPASPSGPAGSAGGAGGAPGSSGLGGSAAGGAASASSGGASSSSLHTVDIKRYARVEKVPGGEIEASRVLDGVMLAKDVTHPKMRRRIENPRIILLDCPLEYKKGESQTNIEITKEEDWNRILEIEEEQIKSMCDRIIDFKPDLIFTEKGVSDLAQHYLLKADITAIRRVRKSDNNRIARATGATIVNRVEDLRESDVGDKCGLFHIEKLGDEYFTFLEKCKDPKACTILLRGPSKDIINEIERNLADAMAVARNVVFHPFLAPGGGATEMAIAVGLSEFARSSAAASADAANSPAAVPGVGKPGSGVQAGPIRAVADAMEVIPRTLIQNCGGNAIRTLTTLRAKHANGEHSWGVDGDSGKVVDMKENGLYESAAVKVQTLKTAIESASLLLRVDDVVSARRAREQGGGGGGPQVHNMPGPEDGAPDGDMPGMG